MSNSVHASETAYDLFKRKYGYEPFQLRSAQFNQYGLMDTISMDDFVEIKTNNPSEVSIATLDVINQFATQYPENGIVIHISLNNSLFLNLHQSGLLQESSENILKRHQVENRLQSVVVHNSMEFIAAYEYISEFTSYHFQPILITMENMTSLLVLDNRNLDKNSSHFLSIPKILECMKNCRGVYHFWLSPNSSKINDVSKEDVHLWKETFSKLRIFSYS